MRVFYLTMLANERTARTYVVECHQQLLAALRLGDAKLAQHAVFKHYVCHEHDSMSQVDVLDATADAMTECMLRPINEPAAMAELSND